VPAPDLHATTDPDVIARGEYLVLGLAHCNECHVGSAEEYQRFVDTGVPTPMAGGMPLPLGPLGTLYTKNLTPDPETGIGRYSDPQIARMLRHGVRPDGRASIPLLMPFSDTSDEDIVAILSYLRAQPPVRRVVPQNEWTLLGKVLKVFVSAAQPKTDGNPPRTSPPQESTPVRGEYLAKSVANCVGCHTPFNEMTGAITGPLFSGGNAMEPAARPGVDLTVWFEPPNITPLRGSALMKFPDRPTFVARFKNGGRKYAGSPMPWEALARVTEEDLGALYEFLHTLEPAGAPAPEEPTVKK
jgi:mono/diheme cytochrome c family protein